jgi:putative ATPase
MTKNLNLFRTEPKVRSLSTQKTLAEILRPKIWDDFVGLSDLKGDLIERLSKSAQIAEGTSRPKPPSLIFWGPPGSGKTTLAKLLGKNSGLRFVEFSAVLGGIKEVREIIDEAERYPEPTILFVDEIHRFNKSQQDAFLPHVEAGTVILFGATTENPSFYVNQALLSRARVVVVPQLSSGSLRKILTRALEALAKDDSYGSTAIKFSEEAAQFLVQFTSGDARRLINIVESLVETHPDREFDLQLLQATLGERSFSFYDREGEEHYNIASAFIKSLRGSDPDAALYWGFRMIEAGEDPRFLIRRMIIFASEDIGNGDPRALPLAVSTAEAFDRLGLPEGRIPLAHCITFLATAPKSNRSYLAMHEAVKAVQEQPAASVPLHLRNAPTKLMKDLEYGSEYKYPHDDPRGYVTGVQYLPDKLHERALAGYKMYEPKEVGYEKNIKERTKILNSGVDK